ncbi:TraV family lipoprotein [Endozoicomonas sp. ALD040]|uniref:TraV family lipoprotein n=1 Tax=Endozoicomonas sp. ALD040 TaxID=3403079 RepID=UPI003BB15C9A
MCKHDTRALLLMVSLVPVIQGCSLFGVGEAEYACPEPGKGVCKSARQVYQDTGSTSAENLFSSAPKNYSEPDLRFVTPEAIPNRTPAQILKIWIAPWVDKQGNWHSGGVVMTDIAPRDWQSAIPVYLPSND